MPISHLLTNAMGYCSVENKRNLALRRPAYQSGVTVSSAAWAVDGRTHSAFSWVCRVIPVLLMLLAICNFSVDKRWQVSQCFIDP